MDRSEAQMATSLARRERALDGLRTVWGIRVVYAIGPLRVLRYLAALLVGAAFLHYLTRDGATAVSDGHDIWTYFAAGERLNAGHLLYQLLPGDEAVKLLPPTPVPLVGPPLAAVLWRPLALLPAWLATWGWFTVSALAMLGTAAWIVVKGNVKALLIVCALAVSIGETAESGNLNSFLAPALALAWWSSERKASWIAGVVAAAGGVLKVGPAAPVLWLAARRDRLGLAGFVVGGALLALLSLLGAGLQAHFDYLKVALQSTTVAGWGASVPGALSQLGAPSGVVSLSIPVVWICGAAAIWMLRDRSGAAFCISVLLVVWGTPVVHVTATGLLLALAAPFTPSPFGRRGVPDQAAAQDDSQGDSQADSPAAETPPDAPPSRVIP